MPAERRGPSEPRTRTRAGCARSPGWSCWTREDRILLLHGHEPEDPGRRLVVHPGGGLEGDETREEAALRELAEETGITEVELGPVLWRRMCSFPFAGRRWDQDEWYYLARTTQTATGPGRAHGAGAAQRRRSALVDVPGTVRGA